MPGKVCPSKPRESSAHLDIYQVKIFFDCSERVAERSNIIPGPDQDPNRNINRFFDQAELIVQRSKVLLGELNGVIGQLVLVILSIFGLIYIFKGK